MKSLFRHYIITIFVLGIVDYGVSGISISGGIKTYLIASLVLMLLNMFVKPIIKIVLLPISVVTLGLTGIFINSFLLFVLDRFVNEITVSAWKFSGIGVAGYSIPAIEFGIIPTYIICAVMISFLISFLRWL